MTSAGNILFISLSRFPILTNECSPILFLNKQVGYFDNMDNFEADMEYNVYCLNFLTSSRPHSNSIVNLFDALSTQSQHSRIIEE